MVNDDCIATPTMILAAQEAERKHYGINRGAGFRPTGAMELKKLIEAALVQRKEEALRAHNSDSAEPVAYLTTRGMEQRVVLAKFVDEAEAMFGSNGWTAQPLYLASPPAKEVEVTDEMVERFGKAFFGEGFYIGSRGDKLAIRDGLTAALTNRTPDDEVGNG